MGVTKLEMSDLMNLQRFIDAQDVDYEIALNEIKSGKKRSHWIFKRKH